MHESPQDIDALQRLLDVSYAQGGRHLLSIHTPERRMSAAQLAQRLGGMTLLVLATVMQRYQARLVPGHPVEPYTRAAGLHTRDGLLLTLHRI